MEGLFNSELFNQIIAGLLGGSALFGIGKSFVTDKIRKKLTMSTAAHNAKDKQITELQQGVETLTKVVGILVSNQTTQALASRSMPAEVKKEIVDQMATIEKISNIKLTGAAEKAIKFLTDIDAVDLKEKQRENIMEKANQAQEVLDKVNETTENAIDSIEV